MPGGRTKADRKRAMEDSVAATVAVIVNDMAELNIDAALVANSRLVQRGEKLVTMQNGCICCTLREDLVEELAKLAAAKAFDYVVIESTGISEPMQVAETFTFSLPDADDADAPAKRQTAAAGDEPEPEPAAAQPGARKKRRSSSRGGAQSDPDEDMNDDDGAPSGKVQDAKAKGSAKGKGKGRRASEGGGGAGDDDGDDGDACPLVMTRALSDVARLDTCVTVVDAASFHDNLASIEELADRFGRDVPEGDDRSIANLLVEQVEFADVILLNKTDLVKPSQLRSIAAALRRLNPRATLHETVRSQVDVRLVVGTGRFDMEQAAEAPGWLQSMKGEGPTPESEEYGISTYVFRSRRPFHPGRLYTTFLERYFLTKVINVMDGPGPDPSGPDGESEDSEASGSGSGSDDDDDPESSASAAAAAEPGASGGNSSGSGSSGSDDEEEADDGEGEGGGRGGVAKDNLAAYEAARAEVMRAMKRDLGYVMRSKGFLWLATQPGAMVGWGQAGVVLQMAREGPWFAAIPEDEWPEDPKIRDKIRADFDPDSDVGDRRQEIVFIGQGLKPDAIRQRLESCLATDEELADVEGMEDPLFGEEAGEE
ncbi:hypothetical protein HYH03_012039 [Edaphochlamys debaryana]|uniref:CobW C-terminal domain-containing protein n=1 Tax=Edaphochlamys debaryana TaxID=47281 RepID=A0A835XUS6_9CHLO|nr:hypothetical protein HYH03_012039 [Edaphochlamys debaryana]|eukprot:KAG2489398.1 hypothetical protein HYH03_012039 [Edaphochlamys debaryana]